MRTTSHPQHIDNLRRRQNVRLNLLPRHRALLIRIRKPNELGFRPRGAEKGEAERNIRARFDQGAAPIQRNGRVGWLEP